MRWVFMAGAAEHGLQHLPWAWIGAAAGLITVSAVTVLVVGLCRAAARTPPPGPGPWWPTQTIEAVMSHAECTLCKTPGRGNCTCTSTCGHPGCVGDHTIHAGLTYAQVIWLRALDKEVWK